MKVFSKIFGKNGSKKLKVLASVLAAIVVFTTTYSLILPAITIDNETAQEEPGLEIMEVEEDTTEAAVEAVIEDVVAAVAEADPAEEPVIEEAVVEEEPAAEEAAEEEPASIIEETAETEPEGETAEAEPASIIEETAETEPEGETAEAESETEVTEPSETTAESRAASETTTAKAEEETSAAVKMPAVAFTEETNKDFADKNLPNIIVKVEAEEGTFPEGTTMKVKYVLGDNTVETAVKDAVNKDSRVEGAVRTIHTVDITFFNKEGKEIEPLKEIKVTFESDTIKKIDNPVLVHIPDEGKGEPEVVDQLSEQKENEIIFKADQFSKYSITELVTGGAISADGISYKVTVSYDENAMIPSDAYLVISEIEDASDDYESYLSEAEAALLEGSDAEISFANFFNITIMSGDEVVQPQAPVEVKIEYAEAQSVTEDTQVSAIEFSDETSNTLDVNVSGTNEQIDSVSFEAEKLSEYGIVGTETLTGGFVAADGSTYEVTVTYGPEANIPKDSTLKLVEYAKDDAEYQEAKAKTDEYRAETAVTTEDEDSVDEEAAEDEYGFSALDISIIGPDGNEIEPAAEVSVSIVMKSLPEGYEAEDLQNSLEVYHLVNNDGTLSAEKVASPLLAESEISADENGASVDFKTESFSTYTITWNNSSVTLHFVDEEGNDISGVKFDGQPIGNTNSVAMTSLLTSNYSELDLTRFTADDSTFSNAHLTTYNGQIIGGSLQRRSSSRFRYYNRSGDWTDINNNTNIYLVFSSKPSSGGGGGGEGGDDDTPDLGEIGNSKEVTSNHDGTYNIALSVTGTAQNKTEDTDINVVFVVDHSNSMSFDGGRIGPTNTAVRNMANALLQNNTTKNPDAIELALVTFNATAETKTFSNGTNWTNDYDVFNGQVNDNLATGTNWEAALRHVINVDKGDGDPTYVIFFTDGDPTQYVDGGTTLYDNAACYWAARDEARAIVNSGKILYGIFAYGSSSADYLGKLVNYAYNDSSAKDTYYYQASNPSGVEAALAEILDTINMNFAYADVEIDDGITGLTSVTFEDVDPESFVYSITYKDYTSATNYTTKTVDITVNNDGSITIPAITYGVQDSKATAGYSTKTTTAVTIKGATYDEATKAVAWDMEKTTGTGDAAIYMLEEAWTYTVNFKVWPSQASYDLVAALNNGLITWGEDYVYTDEDGAQVTIKYEDYQSQINTSGTSYSLKTNTSAGVKYRQVTEKTDSEGHTTYEYGDEKEVNINYAGSMGLDGAELKLIKNWDTSLSTEDYENINEVTLYILEDNPTGEGFDKDDPSTYYKAVTLTKENGWAETVAIAPGVYDGTTFKTTGHTYSVFEPDIDSHYEFNMTPTHPMLNGTTHNDDTDMVETYNTTAPYTIMDRDDENTTTYSVSNTLKGGINIKKEIDVADEFKQFVNEDQLFSFTIRLFDENGDPVYTGEEGHDVSGSLGTRYYKEDGTTVRGGIPETGEVTLTMKASEAIRIVNVPAGTYYTVEEGDLSSTVYSFKQSDWLVRHHPTIGSEDWVTDDSETITDSQTTKSHRIYPNSENNVTFTNTYEGTGYIGTKVWDDNNYEDRPETVTFQLYQKVTGSEAETTAYGEAVTVGVDSNGDALTGTTVVDDNTWTYTWKGLPKKASVEGSVVEYEYSFKEVSTPEGYSSVMSEDGKTVTNILAKKVRFVKQETGSTKMLEGAVFTFPLGGETYTLTSDSTGLMKTSDGTSEFTMPVSDTPYELTETTAPDGYNKLTGKVRVTVGKTSVTAGRSDDNTVTYVVDLPTENEPYYTVHITNSSGVELPMTGGSGTLPYTLGGIALILASALMYGFRMRRRERRLKE